MKKRILCFLLSFGMIFSSLNCGFAAAEEKAAAPISEAAEAAAYLTPELIHSGMISPMIGMEELTAGCENLQEVIAKRGQ